MDLFSIPETWLWVQLGDVSLIQEGAGIRKWQYRDSGIQILCVTNILDGAVDLTKKELYISEEEYNEKYLHLTLNNGDIVTACSGGSWGKVAIFNSENTIMLNTSTLRMRFWGDICCNKFLYYICQSRFFKKQLQGQLSGMQPNFGYAHYSRIVIPLPPLAEQKRIVAKIEELLPYIDRYERAWSKLEQFNSRFPEDMKKSLLQYAIQGKLVEQRPEEGTAEELFAQIQEEKQRLIAEKKIKKEKPLPEITDDEKPFDIPKNWKWCRIGSIGITKTGNTPSKAHPEYQGKDIPFITPGDILDGDICYENQALSIAGMEVARICEADSILQVCIGGSISKVAMTKRRVTFNQQINSITPFCCDNRYIYYVMMSFYFSKTMKEKAGGTATPIINRGIWDTLLLPLPPLDEQKRIVEKLEQLLPLCERLK